MKLKGLALGCAVAFGFGLCVPAFAQDDPEPETTTTQAAPDDDGGFWSRFALYVEVLYGQAEGDAFSASTATSETQTSVNAIALDEVDHTQFSIGWQLPEDKGRFRLMMTGWNESEYSFSGSGRRAVVSQGNPVGNPGQTLSEAPVEWWRVRIDDGVFTSTSATPTWDPATDDANGDGFISEDEIRYIPNGFGTTRNVTDSLDTQAQTWDLLFERGFGGRRYSGIWSAGLRYFDYEGNTPVAAWLRTNFVNVPGQHGGYQGFTDGATLRLINFTQDTTAIGPTGSVEFDVNFFRQRLVLFAKVMAAFVVQDSETDSGLFFSLVDTASGALLPAEARVQEDRDKDVWHTAAEGGLRLRLVEGLHLTLSYYLYQYADALLMPTTFSIPNNQLQIDQGVEALFATRDLEFDGWRGGFSFQF
jgi:hypothetical protein